MIRVETYSCLIRDKFLEAIRTFLKGEIVPWMEMSADEWDQLFQLANKHNVLPMIYETVFRCPAAKNYPEMLKIAGDKAVRIVIRQTRKTRSFLELYAKLQEIGVQPVVVKGLACRHLYPLPDHRPSTDEDLLIKQEDFLTYHEAIQGFGMCVMNPNQDALREHEVSYGKDKTKLYIELHKQLFSPESTLYKEFNDFFEGAMERAVWEDVGGAQILTLNYTDHLLYMICHAFKHFIGRGVGIRPLCDMILHANKYGKSIDWSYIMECCKTIHADKFLLGILRIGKQYLTLDPEEACYPKEWDLDSVDISSLLEDIIDGGVLGGSSNDRLHSSNVTLQSMQKKRTIWYSLFPSKSYMLQEYSFLKKRIYLLPIAWLMRIFKYIGQMITKQKDPTSSLKIGAKRVKLLQEYGIIKTRK